MQILPWLFVFNMFNVPKTIKDSLLLRELLHWKLRTAILFFFSDVHVSSKADKRYATCRSEVPT